MRETQLLKAGKTFFISPTAEEAPTLIFTQNTSKDAFRARTVLEVKINI